MSKFFDSNRHLSARQEGCFYQYFGKIIVWRIAQALCFVSSGDLNLVYTIYYSFISFKIKTEDYDDTIEQQLNLMYSAIKKLNDIEIYYNNRNNKLKYQNEWWTYTISRIWSTRYLY